jgi:hypothetical protein
LRSAEVCDSIDLKKSEQRACSADSVRQRNEVFFRHGHPFRLIILYTIVANSTPAKYSAPQIPVKNTIAPACDMSILSLLSSVNCSFVARRKISVNNLFLAASEFSANTKTETIPQGEGKNWPHVGNFTVAHIVDFAPGAVPATHTEQMYGVQPYGSRMYAVQMYGTSIV